MAESGERALRQQVVKTAQQMAALGLSPQRTGNVSVRFGDGMLVTPTGLAYETMRAADIVHVSLDGDVRPGQKRPSSETPMHLAIYQDRSDVTAIVHCHSQAATALSCLRKAIPAFHYMVAVAGGKDIPCAKYATVATPALARSAVQALKDRRACLLANHGQMALGKTLDEALAMAEQVELLAQMYMDALRAGKPVILGDAEMKKVLKAFEHYGQQDG